MNANRVAPILMVMNEELWIERVLRPLTAVFSLVFVGDTGSTDATARIAADMRGVLVIQYGRKNPAELGQVRYRVARHAMEYGKTHAWLVDGDHLYSESAIRWVLDQKWPDGRFLGFVTMLSLDQDEQGQLWEMADLFSYPPIYPINEKWHGDYPFEVPLAIDDPNLYHYFSTPPDHRYHAVHLHRLRRSPHDKSVFLREQKQKQFCMADKPIERTVRFDLESWTNGNTGG
jgi:glycosyltransferase involved in cell wall biosynthesis